MKINNIFKKFKKLQSVAKGITALGIVSCLTALPIMASSHSEAPLTSMDRYADNTDVYAFRSMEANRQNFVTLIANYIPFEDPSGGPQFYRFDDGVLYEINIDNTGDGLPDFSYQFRFTTATRNTGTVLGHTTFNNGGVVSSINDVDYNMPQTYSVVRHNHATGADTVLATNVPTAPSNVGSFVTPNYEAALGSAAVHTINATTGMRIFAGQRDEGFLVDLGGTFDGFNFSSANGGAPISQTGGTSTTDGFNVNSIAIEVPISDLTRDGSTPTNAVAANAVVGIYATASRASTRVIGTLNSRTTSGNFTQVSREGNPLVNEVVIPLGLKDAFNSIRPNVDGTLSAVNGAIADPDLAKLLSQKFSLPVPQSNTTTNPRSDLIAIFATGISPNTPNAPAGYSTFLSDGVNHEMLRLNVAIPPTPYTTLNRLGLLGNDFAGFPNGRRVEDDVVDIELRAIAGGTPFTPAFYQNADKTLKPNAMLSDGVYGNDYNIDPQSGAITGSTTVFGGNENPATGANIYAQGGTYDYLQRFPYLAPPHAGNTPRVPNKR